MSSTEFPLVINNLTTEFLLVNYSIVKLFIYRWNFRRYNLQTKINNLPTKFPSLNYLFTDGNSIEKYVKYIF